MSIASMTRQPARPAAASRYRVTFPHLLKSEVVKFTTVRSTIWSLSVVVLMILGISSIMAAAAGTENIEFSSNVPFGAFAPMVSVAMAQLVFVVLGVISIGSEYSTGMIRSTLGAAPTRLPALFAKMVIMWIAAFVVTLISLLAAHFLVQMILSRPELEASLSDPQVLRMLVGGALYVATIAVFALTVGAIVRNTAGGISIVVGLLLVLPGILSMIPWEWVQNLADYMPGVGESVMYPEGESTHAVWVGFGILVAWTVASTVAASFLLKRRDA